MSLWRKTVGEWVITDKKRNKTSYENKREEAAGKCSQMGHYK